jgi:hypothetical protein
MLKIDYKWAHDTDVATGSVTLQVTMTLAF